MKDTKIIQVLRTFSPAELKEFGYFVHSPFYNRIKNVTKLFDSIKKFHPDFTSRFVNKEYLYKKITEGRLYNDDVMRNLCSDLYKLTKEFLSIKSFGRTGYQRKMLLLVELRKRQSDKKILKEYDKLMNSFENTQLKDEEYYFNSFKLLNMRNDNFIHKNVEIFQKNISNEISGLAQYFIIHMFDRYFQVNRFRASYKRRVNYSFLSDMSKVMKKYGYMESPLVKIYYEMFMILVTMEEIHYYNLKELLITNFNILNHYNRVILLQSLTAFFLYSERRGIKIFRNDWFELYRDYEKRGDFIFDKQMDDAMYTTAVSSALVTGEFGWAEKFTEDYRKFLPQNMRQDAYYYNRAKILHAQKKNEEALESLARIIPTHHTIKAVVKVVELQVLFELGEFDSIYHKLDAFRHFVGKNEEMSANMRDSLKNFIKMYFMLVEIKIGNNKYSPEQIKAEISKRKHSHSMDWINEKIEELEK